MRRPAWHADCMLAPGMEAIAVLIVLAVGIMLERSRLAARTVHARIRDR